jgi:acetate kinase
VRILTVNAGSSSLKLRVVEGAELQAAEDLSVAGLDANTIARALSSAAPIEAVAHRFVHGGRDFRGATRIDQNVEPALRGLSDLAPLHQAKALEALDAVRDVVPDVPTVACFDTTFHATLPAAAATYAVPRAWRQKWGLRRYGFHGLSHAYASHRAAELLETPLADLRTVVCHLGAGASLCAVQGGSSVDTTMGFTPLEGLVMATRAGSIDPGAVLWLIERAGLSASEVGHALEHESGLLALAGSDDMREVRERADHGDADATLARDVYLHSLRAGIAAMASSLGGLDALVFTGGVGEHDPGIREAAVGGLGFLGIGIDTDANIAAQGDEDISSADARARTLVINAREDLEMARQTESVLGEPSD